MTREYAFDCRLDAVVRVRANSEAEARAALEKVLDACDLTPAFVDGYNSVSSKQGVTVTEASVGRDCSEIILFELDGVEQ